MTNNSTGIRWWKLALEQTFLGQRNDRRELIPWAPGSLNITRLLSLFLSFSVSLSLWGYDKDRVSHICTKYRESTHPDNGRYGHCDCGFVTVSMDWKWIFGWYGEDYQQCIRESSDLKINLLN
jgi:hypothetical protein